MVIVTISGGDETHKPPTNLHFLTITRCIYILNSSCRSHLSDGKYYYRGNIVMFPYSNNQKNYGISFWVPGLPIELRDLSFNIGSNLGNTGCQEVVALAKYVFLFSFPMKKLIQWGLKIILI